MNLNDFMKDLATLHRKATKRNDLAVALKAKESQIKLFLEQKKTSPLDINLLSENELDDLITSTENSLKESK